jgi:hypothetical protein
MSLSDLKNESLQNKSSYPLGYVEPLVDYNRRVTEALGHGLDEVNEANAKLHSSINSTAESAKSIDERFAKLNADLEKERAEREKQDKINFIIGMAGLVFAGLSLVVAILSLLSQLFGVAFH